MGKKQQQTYEFACVSSALDDEEQAYLCGEMEKRGARGSGCLLLQAPLWLLLALALIACWLVCVATTRRAEPAPVEMLMLWGFLVPIGVSAARQWLWQVYYRTPKIIGGRYLAYATCGRIVTK